MLFYISVSTTEQIHIQCSLSAPPPVVLFVTQCNGNCPYGGDPLNILRPLHDGKITILVGQSHNLLTKTKINHIYVVYNKQA